MSDPLFFQLVQIATGARASFDAAPTEAEWDALYKTAGEQSVSGVLFGALDVLPEEQMPSRDQCRRWMMDRTKAVRRNALADQRSRELTAYFAEAGFKSAVLNGKRIVIDIAHVSVFLCGEGEARFLSGYGIQHIYICPAHTLAQHKAVVPQEAGKSDRNIVQNACLLPVFKVGQQQFATCARQQNLAGVVHLRFIIPGYDRHFRQKPVCIGRK